MIGIQINVREKKGRLIRLERLCKCHDTEGGRRIRDQKLRPEVFSNLPHDILRPNTVILQRLLPLSQVESTKFLSHTTVGISPFRNPEQLGRFGEC